MAIPASWLHHRLKSISETRVGMLLPHSDGTPASSAKYDRQSAERYFRKHRTGFWRKLSNWREQAMARKSLRLAGSPASVLDVPCGAGRFWTMLAEDSQRRIYGADGSLDMIHVGLDMLPQEITCRLETFQCSASSIPQPDNFVENVFCMRLLHHVGKEQDRLGILREFARVASQSVVFSLWVDGNYKAWRQCRLKQRLRRRDDWGRVVIDRATIEAECARSGLEITGHVDFLKYYAMLRTYVCRVVK